MKGKRTGLEFENHVLTITEQDGLVVHHLKKPNTVCDNIKYINTNGILAVTGDYSNWIFCREFHPTADGYVSEGYWREKLKIGSCQEPSKYDPEKTEEEIRELLKDEDEDSPLIEGDKEFLNGLLSYVDDELSYTYSAYRDIPRNSKFDYENIPYVKTVSYHFLAILDGFDEICRRMKEEEQSKIVPIETVAS